MTIIQQKAKRYYSDAKIQSKKRNSILVCVSKIVYFLKKSTKIQREHSEHFEEMQFYSIIWKLRL